jgi:putative ABC transport system substrate-binding protein
MRRREFVLLLGGTAAWPLAVHAQQTDSVRRIGALFSQLEGDPEGQARAEAFRQGLKDLGWIEGRNLHVEYRWAGGGLDRQRPLAAELMKQKLEVVFASATSALVALREATNTMPIVFAQVTDPVGAGFVQSLGRPGGNITGLTQHEFGIGVKWLELLKQLAPRVSRVAVLHDQNPARLGYLRAMEPASSSMGLAVVPTFVRDRNDITSGIEAIVSQPNGGLIVLPGPVGSTNRDLIIALAARHRLPAVYAFRYHVVSGGLASYGIDNIDLFRRAAWYVDRILKGDKPSELPVQHPTKFQLVINLKTAKALGLDPPLSLLARTDEVIE